MWTMRHLLTKEVLVDVFGDCLGDVGEWAAALSNSGVVVLMMMMMK